MLRKFLKGNYHRFREMISPYIDGRITEAERQALESHLASCQGCRQELESLRTTVGLLHRLPLAEVPRSFTVVETRPVAVPTALGPLRWATAVAVLVLVVLSAGDLFHIYPEKSGPPSEKSIVAASPTPESQEMARSAAVPSPAPMPTIPPGGGDKALGGTPAPDVSNGQIVVTTPTLSPEDGTSEGVFGVAVPSTTAGNEAAEGGYRWPVHQIELAVLGVVAVMLAATIMVWRRGARSSVKEGGDG